MAATAAVILMFGAGGTADPYFIAIILPRLAQTVAQAVVSQVLVPGLTREKYAGGEESLSRDFLGLSLAAGALAYVALFALAPFVANLLAPGFDGAAVDVTAQLLRFTALGIVLAPVTEVLCAHLNVHRIFARAALAESLRPLCVCTAVLTFGATYGVAAAGWGFGAGFAAHALGLAVLCMGRARMGLPRLSFRNTALREVLSQMRMPFVGALVNFSPVVVQRTLASLLAPGTVTAFSVAHQVVGTIFVIALRSVGVVSHPEVSRLAANNELDRLNAVLARSVKLTTVVGSVAFIGIAVTVFDGVHLFHGVGAFTSADASAIVQLLFILALSLPFSGMVRVLRSPHFAFGQPLVPSLHAIAMGVSHVLFQVAGFYTLGAYGIAFAQVAWSVLSAGTAFLFLPHSCRPVFRLTGPALARTIASFVAAGVLLQYGRSLAAGPVAEISVVTNLLWLFGMAAAALAITAVFYVFWLRNDLEIRPMRASSSARST